MTFWVNKLNEGTELQSSEVVEMFREGGGVGEWSRLHCMTRQRSFAWSTSQSASQPFCQSLQKNHANILKVTEVFFETLILGWDCIIPHTSVCKINLMFFLYIFGFTIFFTKCLLIWWENRKKRNYPPSQFNDSKYCAHMFWRNDKGTYSLW